MKKFLALLFLLPVFMACSKDSEKRNVNPYLPDYSFSVNINTALPQYANLRTPMFPVVVDVEGAGVSGLIVMKITDTDYRAWEAACPNQYPTGCSKMTVEPAASQCECACESFTYNLLSGVGGGSYTMKPYRYEILGDVVRVYN